MKKLFAILIIAFAAVSASVARINLKLDLGGGRPIFDNGSFEIDVFPEIILSIDNDFPVNRDDYMSVGMDFCLFYCPYIGFNCS